MSVGSTINKIIDRKKVELDEQNSSPKTKGDSSSMKQGSSKTASHEDMSEFESGKKVSSMMSKDTTLKASTDADRNSRPKQGSSKDASYEDLGDVDNGKNASSKMSKDSTMSPKTKGDSTNMKQGSSKTASFSTIKFENEEYDDDLEIDEEIIDEIAGEIFAEYEGELDEDTINEISKKVLGNYINKANTSTARSNFNMGGQKAFGRDKPNEDDRKTSEKRRKGIATAVKKLTKEEMDSQLNSIFGEDLSEEFKEKAIEIFEAAVIARVNDEIENIQSELEEKYAEMLSDEKEAIHEKINKYMDYIVENWMDENQLAVESGIKNEISESFIEGIKNLFQEHYIEIPESKVDVVEEMQNEIDSMNEKLNEAVDSLIEVTDELTEMKQEKIFNELSEGLVDTDIDRFYKLVEGIEYKNADSYRDKLEMIKENHFGKKLHESVEEDHLMERDIHNNDRMALYCKAVSGTKK